MCIRDRVQEGAAIAREQHVDFILAVGGGSVIDCCKVISAQALLDEDIWEMEYGKGQFPNAGIPVGAVAVSYTHLKGATAAFPNAFLTVFCSLACSARKAVNFLKPLTRSKHQPGTTGTGTWKRPFRPEATLPRCVMPVSYTHLYCG